MSIIGKHSINFRSNDTIIENVMKRSIFVFRSISFEKKKYMEDVLLRVTFSEYVSYVNFANSAC